MAEGKNMTGHWWGFLIAVSICVAIPYVAHCLAVTRAQFAKSWIQWLITQAEASKDTLAVPGQTSEFEIGYRIVVPESALSKMKESVK